MHNSGMIAFPPLDSPDLKEILRPAPEPVRLVDDALAHSILLADPAAYLAFLERELRDIASGDTALTLPPKAVFDDGPGKGDFRVMPCVTRGANRLVKTVKVVGTNLVQHDVPDQVTVGKAMLLHPEENYVTHLFDANALSSIRTGACVALAIRLLATRRRHLLFVGAGRVGFYGAVFAGALDDLRPLGREAPQVDARRLVRAVLAVHDAEHAELGEGRHAAEVLLDVRVLRVRDFVLPEDVRGDRRIRRQGHRHGGR